ncbi:hypothetical protein [Microcoleus sp.]|uniref:hypothetical protein n=1 Tax=Microcoleus sp. TaxID=44472 RepID=UPI00403E80E2
MTDDYLGLLLAESCILFLNWYQKELRPIATARAIKLPGNTDPDSASNFPARRARIGLCTSVSGIFLEVKSTVRYTDRNSPTIALLNKVRYALCSMPMPYALCPRSESTSCY